MHYAALKTHDVANGPGVRVSLFVSGCTHRCPGCFNPEAWDFTFGAPFTPEVEEKILAALAPAHMKARTRVDRQTSSTPYSPFIMVETVSAVGAPEKMHLQIWQTDIATA